MNEMESWYIKSKCEFIKQICEDIMKLETRAGLEQAVELITESAIKIENDLIRKTTVD